MSRQIDSSITIQSLKKQKTDKTIFKRNFVKQNKILDTSVRSKTEFMDNQKQCKENKILTKHFVSNQDQEKNKSVDQNKNKSTNLNPSYSQQDQKKLRKTRLNSLLKETKNPFELVHPIKKNSINLDISISKLVNNISLEKEKSLSRSISNSESRMLNSSIYSNTDRLKSKQISQDKSVNIIDVKYKKDEKEQIKSLNESIDKIDRDYSLKVDYSQNKKNNLNNKIEITKLRSYINDLSQNLNFQKRSRSFDSILLKDQEDSYDKDLRKQTNIIKKQHVTLQEDLVPYILKYQIQNRKYRQKFTHKLQKEFLLEYLKLVNLKHENNEKTDEIKKLEGFKPKKPQREYSNNGIRTFSRNFQYENQGYKHNQDENLEQQDLQF